MFVTRTASYFSNSHWNRTAMGRLLFKASVLLTIYFAATALPMSAQVVIDDPSSSEGAFSATGLTSLTVPHTVGTGSNRALYVGISTSTTTLPIGAPAERVSTVTFNLNSAPGNLIPLTRVGSVISLDSKNTVELFRLVAPPNGAAAPPSGAGTITVNFVVLAAPPIANLLVNYAVAGVTSYSGVSQTTPNGAFVSAAQFNSTPTVNVSDEVAGDLVLDVLGVSPTAGFVQPGALQTRRYTGSAAFGNAFDIGAGSTEPGSSTSGITMSWLLNSNPDNWALGAIAIKQFVATAAEVTIGGRVTNSEGSRGVARARVTITDSSGVTRSAVTNPFGYYRLTSVNAGETYIMNAFSKQYSFNPRVLAVNDDITDMNFVAR